MNGVVVKAWGKYMLKSSPIIVKAFKVTNLCPLMPPQSDDIAVANHACTAAMQCGEREKAVELESIAHSVLKPVAFSTRNTRDDLTILKARRDTSRNLLIRSVAYEILNKTLLLPSQEIKRIQQEQLVAKDTKVGKIAIPQEQRRQNPDTSRGLYVNAATRAQARAVQRAKEHKLELDSISREKSLQKTVNAKKKRREVYERVVSQMQGKEEVEKEAILKELSTETLKLTYQHLDGMVSKLPNGRKETFITVLLEKLKRPVIRHVLLNNKKHPPLTDEENEGDYEGEMGKTANI